MEESVQCDATRRRHKMLSHLPASVRFFLCELDVSHLVSAHNLAPFADEIHRRAQRREAAARRAKHDARREAKAAAAAEAVRARSLLVTLSLPSTAPPSHDPSQVPFTLVRTISPAPSDHSLRDVRRW
jgi:hypothetical protein